MWVPLANLETEHKATTSVVTLETEKKYYQTSGCLQTWWTKFSLSISLSLKEDGLMVEICTSGSSLDFYVHYQFEKCFKLSQTICF